MIHLRTLLAAPAAALAAALTLAACVAPEPVVTEETIQRVIKSSFNTTEYNYPPEVIARLDSDEGQKMCSAARNEIARLPPAQLNDFIAKSRKEIRFPAKLMGDWKQGERIAQNGVGLRFGMSPDKPGQPNGGNCYACHQVSPQELSFGTVGPSLLGYGKQRGAGVESQKFVYEKVYNAWVYLPCSNMPRFGHHGVLTPEQITHLVALLLDPASPVNK